MFFKAGLTFVCKTVPANWFTVHEFLLYREESLILQFVELGAQAAIGFLQKLFQAAE